MITIKAVIVNKNSKPKQYIYVSDVKSFLACGDSDGKRIFNLVKEYELEKLGIEMFENRIPQDLFHEWRKKRRK